MNHQNEPQKALDFSKLPPHACSYCGIHDRDCVVLCLKCNKWFCNNKLTQHKKSDIYLHLTKSAHTAITTDRGQFSQRTAISCSGCGKRDAQKLYYETGGQEITIHCLICLKKADKDGFETNYYSPLLQEKRLPYAIVNKSSNNTTQKARQLTYKQVSLIEHQWRMGRDPKIEEIMGIENQVKFALPKIKETYNSAQEYLETNMPIIEREEKDDRKEKENWEKQHLIINWDQKKSLAYVTTPQDTYFNLHLRCGDKVKLFSRLFSAEGTVEFAKDQEICLKLPKGTILPKKSEGHTLKYLWTNVTFERMKDAVGEVSMENEELIKWIVKPPKISKMRYNITNPKALKLLGDFYSERKISGLNKYQLQAIFRSLKNHPIVLIQGPPGTGKTTTLTALIYVLLRTTTSNKKILVCAPSNIAVDNLAEELDSVGCNVLRMYSRTREMSGEVRESLLDISLHEMIQEGEDEVSKKLKNYIQLKKSQEWLTKKEQREFTRLRKIREAQFIGEADVVCCTCITAGDQRLKGSTFQYVIIDEAAQALEPETLIPLQYRAEKLILAGDHKQLGPLVKSKQVKEANFGQSLFERLAPRIHPHILLLQYRMHPFIAQFPSAKFYNNQLETVASNNRIVHKEFPWPEGKPAFFYDIEGREEEPPFRESYLNRIEASSIIKLIYKLVDSKIGPDSIAVITPYSAQKEHLNDLFTKNEILKKVEVASIDGFQGREKDYIIISCVRSNQEIGIGFLNDERRLNVAITRAKYGMILCGNAKVLAQDKLWKDLLISYRTKKLVLYGDIENLRPINYRF